MDVHTIRHMRDAAAAEGHPPKALVHLSPQDTLATALRRLLDSQTSMAPVLSPDPQGTALLGMLPHRLTRLPRITLGGKECLCSQGGGKP